MPASISVPEVSLSIIPASQLAGVQDQKVLIVGQKLAAGSFAGSLLQNMPNDGTEGSLFGDKSHVAGMVREFKKINKASRVDVLPLADAGGGVSATSSVTFAGTATAVGTLTFGLGSAKNHLYKIPVSVGDTAASLATLLDAQIALDTKAPFTSAPVSAVVTITASNKGTLGNLWDIQLIGNSVAGITVTLAGWGSGATDPTLIGILSAIANIRYQTVVWPSAYSLTEIQTELDGRFNVSNDVKDGVCVQWKKGTLATITAAAAIPNSQSVVMFGNKTVSSSTHAGSAIVEMPDVQSSQFAAVRALRLTQGAPLTQHQTTVSALDQFGGIGIASLPYHNTAMVNLLTPDPSDFFIDTDLASFKTSGVSVVGPNNAHNAVIMGDIVTTYLTDTAGNSDTSYKYLNTVDTASVVREFFFTNYKKRFAQSRLTDGDLIGGRDMVNGSSFRAFANLLYSELAEEGLVQAGVAAKKDFDDNHVSTVDVSTGTITSNSAPLLVSQVRVILGTIQFNFRN